MRLSGVTRVDEHTGPPGDPAADTSAERPFAMACRPLELPHPAQGPICITSIPAPSGAQRDSRRSASGQRQAKSPVLPSADRIRRFPGGLTAGSQDRRGTGARPQSSEQDGLPFRRAHRSRRPGRKGVRVARERCESAGCDQALRGLRRRMARPRSRRAERRSPERVRFGINDALVFRTVDEAIPAASSRCPESACCVRSDRGATEGGPPRWMAGRVRLGARPPSCVTWILEPGAEAPDVRHNGT